LLKPILLAAASQDIEAILEYGDHHHGLNQALAYVAKLNTCIEMLRYRPGIGPFHPLLNGNVQSIRQGQHRIYYRVVDEKLLIIRILHVRCDVTLHFD
jgi:toxin ParE1/3/4